MTMLFLALALGLAEARSIEPRISPPLHDGGAVTPGAHQSDKKFFGPPFPADYPEDKRPAPDKHVLDKLKGPDQPYPALQSKADYDADFVKDENSDTGAWQAQFEYDSLRKKLAQKEGDVRRAEDRAAREGKDIDGAQGDSDAAAKRVRDAMKDDDDAAAGEEKVKTVDDFQGPPSDEKLKELKKAVTDAEERLEQQKKAFEKCKQELEEAEKNLKELKAEHVKLEAQLAADTKLWEEQKTVKFNLKKTKESAEAAKVAAAKEKLAAAEKVKAAAEKELAKEKAEHEKAQKNLHKEKAEIENAQKKLEAASAKLQKIHGYKPVEAAHPAKSSSPMASTLSVLSLSILAMRMF
jgi:chromosome segregation ATPase